MQLLSANPLDTLPLEAIAVPVPAITTVSGPARVLAALSSTSLVPVIEETSGRLSRVIADESVLAGDQWQRLIAIPDPTVLTLHNGGTLAEARRLFQESHQSLVPIVDGDGLYTGMCASRRQLLKLMQGLYKPPRIGGLATPLGVYMTSGYYSAGAGVPGLLATGAAFGLLAYGLDWGYLLLYSAGVSVFPVLGRLEEPMLIPLQIGFMLVATLALIRLTPMAGLHAAEHMTINAIESGLEINERNVRAMPREHMRCGTNLMVLLGGIQLGWASLEAMQDYLSASGVFAYSMLWVLGLTFFWRPVGRWLQTNFTTKPPTSAQLASGMKAGRELLAQYQAAPHGEPSLWRRIWGAGIVQMVASFLAVFIGLNLVTDWLLGQGW